MKKTIAVLLALSVASVASARLVQNSSGAFNPATLNYSDGSSWEAGETFNFQVGVFTGSVPASMTDAWSWQAAPSSSGTNLAAWESWGGYWNQFSYDNNDAPLTVGTQAYVWGYNSETLDAGSEWVLLTNPNWTFTAQNPGNPEPLAFDLDTPGTITVGGIGSLDGGALTTSAIPEPSTYALIFGLGILGFLGFRRFRK